MRELRYPRLRERCFFEVQPSGLSVYVMPRPEFQKSFAFFAVRYGGEDVRFRTGGRWRTPPAGVAHFLEHKLFDMPDGGNALQILSARGASPNAFTSADLTGYYFSCTDGFYDNLRTLLTFVMTPYFTEEGVAKERGIIGQEIRMIEDDPNWQLWHGLINSLYVNHTIRNSVAGTEASVAKITPEVLAACHRAFYHPSDMVLCVAGHVEPGAVLQLAAALVPSAGPRVIERWHGDAEPMTPATPEAEREMEVSVPGFLVGFKAEPTGTQRLRLTGELAAELLAGESSPLYARLYGDGLIDKSFGASFESERETAHFVFGGDSSDPAAVTEAILDESLRVAWDGIDEARFQRARKAAYGGRVRALNSLENLCVQTARSHFRGEVYLDFPACYDNITRRDVEELIRSSVSGDRAAQFVVRPKRPQKLPVASASESEKECLTCHESH